MVFIYGIPTSPRLWRHVTPRVEVARSLAWEMVGYGDSITEGKGRDISAGRQAGYLAAWMRRVGLEGAVVCGHDIGSGVAQILAVRHPRLVRGLVLTNSVCYDSWPIMGATRYQPPGRRAHAVPARVVWGAADRFQPIGYGYRLAYELGAALERVEGGRHFTPEDHPEPIARAVNSLLREA